MSSYKYNVDPLISHPGCRGWGRQAGEGGDGEEGHLRPQGELPPAHHHRAQGGSGHFFCKMGFISYFEATLHDNSLPLNLFSLFDLWMFSFPLKTCSDRSSLPLPGDWSSSGNQCSHLGWSSLRGWRWGWGWGPNWLGKGLCWFCFHKIICRACILCLPLACGVKHKINPTCPYDHKISPSDGPYDHNTLRWTSSSSFWWSELSRKSTLNKTRSLDHGSIHCLAQIW